MADTASSIAKAYQHNCWTRCVQTVHEKTPLPVVVIVALGVIALFIVLMAKQDLSGATKAITGYSFLGAGCVIGLIYIPYRREVLNQRKYNQEVVCRNYFSAHDDAIVRLKENMKISLQADDWEQLQFVDPTTKPLKEVDVRKPKMWGTFRHPVTNVEMIFYTLKIEKDQKVQIITLYQKSLASDNPQNVNFYITGDTEGFCADPVIPIEGSPLLSKLINGTHAYKICEEQINE